MILHAGGNHALDPGEGVRTPFRPMGASVAPGRRQTADVPLGAVVVGGHPRVVQEREQLVAVLVQPLPDPQALGMSCPGPQHQLVEPLDDPPVGCVERLGAQPLSVLAQGNGVLEQLDQRPDERSD
jgi:hypothetical protein